MINKRIEETSKTITFIFGSMGMGGAERVISILANRYIQKKWNVNILMLLDNKCEYKLNPNVNLIPITKPGSGRISQMPFWIKEIRKHIKIFKPDRIVSFGSSINVVVLLACIGLDVDIIISERNDPRSDGRSTLRKIATYILYPKSKKVIFQTKWAQSCFPKKIKDKGCIILNPIHVTEKAKNIKSKKIVSVGRLTEQKNHLLLIESFTIVNRKYPDYTLHIYGEGKLRDKLEQKATENEMTDKIILEGKVDNIHEKILDAEMFVLSSNYEGLSNALLEAMTMGLPCISTNCAGSNEVIQNGFNGLIVPIKDVKALSEAMITLIEDKEFSNKLSENAAKTSEEFKSENVLDKWEQVIEYEY